MLFPMPVVRADPEPERDHKRKSDDKTDREAEPDHAVTLWLSTTRMFVYFGMRERRRDGLSVRFIISVFAFRPAIVCAGSPSIWQSSISRSEPYSVTMIEYRFMPSPSAICSRPTIHAKALAG